MKDCPKFAILTPQGSASDGSPINIVHNRNRHSQLLSEMQSLRCRVAVQEGVLAPSALDSSGRCDNFMRGDDQSWHLLHLGKAGNVVGCARILVHPRDVGFAGLRVASLAIARTSAWARQVREAVESELDRARRYDLTLIEPGGWVVDKSLRGTRAAVNLALGTFALARLLGDCVGFLTATVEHASSAILRRLGGRGLVAGGRAIPGHFEPSWGCNMELLRFDTASLNPRFEDALMATRSLLLTSN